MEGYYIRLPSNSSMAFYPENKTSSFTTKLPDELQLSGQWEIGLKEIQYPVLWFNIESSIGVFLLDTQLVSDIQPSHKSVYNLQLPEGYYSSPTKLAEKLTEVCRTMLPYDLIDSVRLTYDVIIGKFTIHIQRGIKIIFHREFSRMTGLRKHIQFSQMGRFTCDIQRGVYSLYIYCDVCKENIVGDVKVPLLQIVPIRGEHGDYICERYDVPIYTPLQRNNISEIKINIMDDTGRKIPFQAGKTIITLHIRKRGLHLQ